MSSAAYTDIENEWRTTPTDLGGWANRASQMLYEARRLREVLEKIAEHATATTGVPDKDKLVGIAQEAHRVLD